MASTTGGRAVTRLEADVKSLTLLLALAHWRLDTRCVPRTTPADSTDAWQAFSADNRRTA